METKLKGINLPIIGYGFIFLLGSFFVFEAINFEPHDFSNYYFSGTFFRNGQFDSSIYFPHHFNQAIAATGQEGVFASFAPQNAFLALFMVPFSLFSIGTAKILFNLLGLLLFVYSVRSLIKHVEINPIVLFLIPIVLFVPLKNHFLFGQFYLILFFFIVEGFIAYKKEKFWLMGVFWGIAIFLKVFPIILVAMLLFKKEFKAVLIFGLTCLGILFMSVLISGIDVWLYYFQEVLPKSNKGEITIPFVQNYQSMHMLLKGLLPQKIGLMASLLLCFKLMFLIIGYYFTKNEKSLLKTISYWILISLIITPAGNTYSLVLLVFPLFVFFENNIKLTTQIILVVAVLILISNVPIQPFKDYPIPFSFPRLIGFVVLVVIFVKENLIHIKWNYFAVIIFPIVIGNFLFQKNALQNDQPLTSDPALLNYDYHIDNNKLMYTYWSQQGPLIGETDVEVKELDTTRVKLIDNQIFYKNQPITFDPSNKLKPGLINDTAIVFLSDYQRGIGFYELRYIPVNNE